MMNYKTLEVESRLFNRNILHLDAETTPEEYFREEEKLIRDKKPYYIQHQLDAGNLAGIHAFEELGFRFVEFRIHRHLQFIEEPVHARYFFPFGCELLATSPETRKAIIEIASRHSADDRFSCDPLVSNELARKRLGLYITKSLASYPRQFVYGLTNQQTGELIGFRTGIFAEPGLVKYFYYFMKKGFNDPQYTSMLETCVQEALYRQGVTRIEAVTSGSNVQEMNDYSLLQGFRVDKVYVLLRKIYEGENG